MNYRPPNWENHYSEEYYKKYLSFAERNKSPYDMYWNMEDCEIAFENGADAMLEGLKKEGIKTNLKNGDIYTIPSRIVDEMRETIGWMVFIPDEEKDGSS